MQPISLSLSTRIVELVFLFIALPLVLAFNPIIPLSLALVFTALVYVAVVSKGLWGHGSWRGLWRSAKAGFSRSNDRRANKGHLLRIGLMVTTFILGSTIYVSWVMPDKLFHVVLGNTGLWLGICVFYTVFSVFPQEFLYRVFFFRRYGDIFPNPWAAVVINGIIFCLAHVMFFNPLVLLLTFCGGVLFAYSYLNTRSFLVVCVEHSLYGLWLYTVGMGAMLAFPSGT